MTTRFLASICGALFGIAAGSVAFYFTREPGEAFSWFLPLVFAAVFVMVSFVAGERFLQALAEVVSRL